VVFSICRIRVTFVDDLGNEKMITGTGFWVTSAKGTDALVTNKHNLDPKIKFGNDTKYETKKVEIELRKYKPPSSFSNETKFFEVSIPDSKILFHPSADAAIIAETKYKNIQDDYACQINIKESDLANEQFFKGNVSLMDIASFIGFPGNSKSKWWDQHWNLGIARSVNIASHPGIPFTHADITTDNTTLVSGLSFSGSSGSVVMLHAKGIKLGEGIPGGNYIAAKVLGIMSGHWDDSSAQPPMFTHSGLSYFTRASSIIELLA